MGCINSRSYIIKQMIVKLEKIAIKPIHGETWNIKKKKDFSQ